MEEQGRPRPGGNYASSLLPQQEAYEQGCDQVCFLDDISQKNIEELGGMNIMASMPRGLCIRRV